MDSDFRRHASEESQEWLHWHVSWGLRHKGNLFPFPPLWQDLTEETNEPAAEDVEPRPPPPQSAYCLSDWKETMDLVNQ